VTIGFSNMAGACNTHGEIKYWSGKYEGKRLFRRPRCRWEQN